MLIIYRSNSTAAEESSIFCENLLKNKNIRSKRIDSDFNKELLNSYLCEGNQLPNIVIVIGGDGTVLKSANELVNYDIPLLSFNIGGNLGFLTQEKDFLYDKSIIEIIENEEFIIDSRTRLKCDVYHKKNKTESELIQSFNALNDFYFKSVEDDISPTNQIEVEIDGEKVNEYKGDGLIVSSSTGSTAYSMAAGGPIMHPSLDAFIINPICPMSLASRPIIIPDKSNVIIRAVKKSKGSIKLWKDGSKCLTINQRDYCKITKGKKPCKMLIFKKSISYYSKLVKKLDWSGDLLLKNHQKN